VALDDSLGILVCGDNHLILAGPLPAPPCARTLASRLGLTLVRLGDTPVAEFAQWRIRTRADRERLEWAVDLSKGAPVSPAVAVLLDELAQRGVTIHIEENPWYGTPCDSPS
jgi:hypothetical protein